MIIEAVRLIVTLGTTAAGFAIGKSLPEWFDGGTVDPDASIVLGAMIGAGVGYVMGGLLGRLIRRGLDRAPEIAAATSGRQLFTGAFGMLTGVIVGAIVAVPAIMLLPLVLGWSLAGLAVIVLGALGATVFAARADDLFAAAGVGPVPSPLASGDRTAFVVDTSAAIDGRILELGRAGLVAGDLWVPEYVLDELQGIADSGKKSTRRRGRRGLDVIDALTGLPALEVKVDERTYPEHPEVDAKLVAMCEDLGAVLVTTDHNLAKAAGVRGVAVLNPHALGESMRPALVSGEELMLLIEREGSEPGQGVGFLDDGTMVVVEDAAHLVGQKVEVEVANALRTSIGRLLFAKLSG